MNYYNCIHTRSRCSSNVHFCHMSADWLNIHSTKYHSRNHILWIYYEKYNLKIFRIIFPILGNYENNAEVSLTRYADNEKIQIPTLIFNLRFLKNFYFSTEIIRIMPNCEIFKNRKLKINAGPKIYTNLPKLVLYYHYTFYFFIFPNYFFIFKWPR